MPKAEMKPKSDISRRGGHYLQSGRAAGKARRLRRVSQSACRQARHGRLWAEWVQGCGQRALCCPCPCTYAPQGCPHEIRTSTNFQQRSCRRHDKAVASGWRWADEASPAPVAPETVFVAVHLSCDCPSEPPSASRAGQAVKGAICRASRRGFRGISSPGKSRPVPVFHDPETPSVTPACNRLNAQPCPPFLRRLRRAEHHRKGEQPWQQKPPAPPTTQGVPPAPPRLTKGQFSKPSPIEEKDHETHHHRS